MPERLRVCYSNISPSQDRDRLMTASDRLQGLITKTPTADKLRVQLTQGRCPLLEWVAGLEANFPSADATIDAATNAIPSWKNRSDLCSSRQE